MLELPACRPFSTLGHKKTLLQKRFFAEALLQKCKNIMHYECTKSCIAHA